MKREILCEKCGDRARLNIRSTPAGPDGPAERVDFTSGRLRVTCACDSCGDILDRGAHCTALSIRIVPCETYKLLAWEREYMDGGGE